MFSFLFLGGWCKHLYVCGFNYIQNLCAIIAPSPDPMMLITLAVPTIALYEGCIWIVWLIDRRKQKAQSVVKY